MQTHVASRRRRSSCSVAATGPQVELLEPRQFLHALSLSPLVQISGTSPFLGHPIEANDPPITINSEVEPSVAVNPNNPRHLVAAWIQDFARGIVAGVSFDGGNTWSSVAIPGTSVAAGGIYPHSQYPWVSFAPNGDVFLSLMAHDVPFLPNPSAVLVSKSTDGGLSWGGPTTVATGFGHLVTKPTITADPSDADVAYAVWTRFRGVFGGHVTGEFARTTDGGRTWERPRTIFRSDEVDSNAGHQIVVLPNGDLVDAFSDLLWTGTHLNGARVSIVRSTDRGATWSSRITVAEIPPSVVINPETGLTVHVAHALGYTDVAVDPRNGNLYLVWKDASLNGGQFDGIAFSMSTDGGFTWSDRIKVNQTPVNIPLSGQQAFLPAVAVNRDGVVAVSYYDFRNNTSAPGLPTDFWMAHAHPSDGLANPASWSSENRLTATSFNIENSVVFAGQYILGTYESLFAQGEDFGAAFTIPSASDSGTIFVRKTLPAGQGAGQGAGPGAGPGAAPAPHLPAFANAPGAFARGAIAQDEWDTDVWLTVDAADQSAFITTT